MQPIVNATVAITPIPRLDYAVACRTGKIMRLHRFTASKVHGYANYDVTFRDRLTFLTGINGSGKTTVLNSIQALITPDLQALQATTYEKITIEIVDDNGKKNSISAAKVGLEDIELSVGTSSHKFVYSPYVADPSMLQGRQSEAETEHYREITSVFSDHPVMKLIASLPTPMFLGIDRRAKLSPEDRRFGVGNRTRFSPGRNIFRGSLAASLSEAADLAQNAYREARFGASRIGERLQQELILSLLTFSQEDYMSLSMPTAAEKRNLKRIESDLEEFPTIFRLPKTEVMKRVAPFIGQLQKTLKSIPANADYNSYFAKNNTAPPYFDDLIRWSSNKSQLKKIGVISEMVAQFNQRQSVVLQPTQHYKDLVNGFLIDSGKSIDYDESGEIVVRINDMAEHRPLSSLSSGEAQIFVMLTNLTFNPAAQRANVFIIDEPELSLHVRWQELFVDSMLSANEKTQFVMATHAPSIILERTNLCVDVVAKSRKSIRSFEKSLQRC
jgi:predicted ATP-binding protein involved in virulence